LFDEAPMRTSQEVYLVIDVGTGSVRCSLYSPEAGFVGQSREPNEIGPRISAERLWNRLLEQIRALVRTHPSHRITCVCITSFLGWVAADKDGNPVTDAWTWMHQEGRYLRQTGERMSPDMPRRMGRKLTGELAAFKWLSLKNENAELYRRASTFFSMKDYLNFRLTGARMTDFVHAAYTGMFSVRSRAWDPELVELFQLDGDKLPGICSGKEVIGEVTEAVSQMTGIPRNTPVLAGGPDGSMAVVGGGGVRPGDTVDVMGTTDVLFTVCEQYESASGSFLVNPHVLPGLWQVGGPLGMTGGTVSWFLEQWNEGDIGETHKTFEELAKRLDNKPTDLWFIPSLTGERTPHWLPSMKGTVVGLTPRHRKEHIYKALLEGIGFSVYSLLQRLKQARFEADRVTCLGGGARNRLGLQIRADISGLEMDVPAELEASTLGAALLCALATGYYRDPGEAALKMVRIRDSVRPDPENHALYQKRYGQYLRLLELMNGFYAQE